MLRQEVENTGRAERSVNVFRGITERKRFEERITRMALYDELTGLLHRSFLSDMLQQSVAAATRRQESVGMSIWMGFKRINDIMGHAAGDHVLREVASRLATRLGGDEFLVLIQAGRGNAREDCIALACGRQAI